MVELVGYTVGEHFFYIAIAYIMIVVACILRMISERKHSKRYIFNAIVGEMKEWKRPRIGLWVGLAALALLSVLIVTPIRIGAIFIVIGGAFVACIASIRELIW